MLRQLAFLWTHLRRPLSRPFSVYRKRSFEESALLLANYSIISAGRIGKSGADCDHNSIFCAAVRSLQYEFSSIAALRLSFAV